MADVKWFKLSTDIFNNRKIRQIEYMPEGDGILVIWIKMLSLASTINDNGMVYLTQEVPYTEQMLATEFDRPLPLVQLALRTFAQFGMIDVVDSVYHISNWEKYQNVDGLEKIREQNRIRQANFKAKKRLEITGNVTDNVTVTQGNATDIDIEVEEEIEKNNKEKAPKGATRFIPPSVEEVREYCRERGNNIDAQAFVDFYQSKGWNVGKTKMKDWKASVRTWERRSGNGYAGSNTGRNAEGTRQNKVYKDEWCDHIYD